MRLAQRRADAYPLATRASGAWDGVRPDAAADALPARMAARCAERLADLEQAVLVQDAVALPALESAPCTRDAARSAA